MYFLFLPFKLQDQSNIRLIYCTKILPFLYQYRWIESIMIKNQLFMLPSAQLE